MVTSALSTAIASGSLAKLDTLNLAVNNIGDAGMTDFSRSIASSSSGSIVSSSTPYRAQYARGEMTNACMNLKKAVTISSNNFLDDGFDFLKQNTNYYLASKEGAWCRNMPY